MLLIIFVGNGVPSRVCVCVSVCTVHALTFESLDLETSSFVMEVAYIISYSMPGPVSTGMSDRFGVQLPVPENYLNILYNQPPR